LPPANVWDDACRRHAQERQNKPRVGKIMIGRGRRDTREVAAARIGRELAAYHAVPKANLQLFTTRAVKLRAVGQMAAEFFARYDWTQEQVRWRGDAKRDSEQHLARLALSIQNRAPAKAEYLDRMSTFYSSGTKGSTTESLLHLLSKPYKNTPTTVRLHSGVEFEKLDPFHRTFELQMGGVFDRDDEGLYVDGVMRGRGLVLTEAFADWVDACNKDPDTPHFFVWLEQHDICTGSQKGLTSVRYGDRSLAWCKILMPGPPVYWKDSSGEGEKQIADTVATRDTNEKQHKYFRTYTIDGTEHAVEGAAAYIWDTMDTIFVFAHISGVQHHSSGNMGKAVQCAGNLIIRNGQIVYVDTDSGHYRPTEVHLRNFCTYLEAYYGLRGDAVVGWYKYHDFRYSTWGKIRSPWVRGV
jgi:hypothetical protein